MNEIETMTRVEFFKLNPPEGRNITRDGRIVSSLGDLVLCDFCNDEITGDITIIYGTYGVCPKCALEHGRLCAQIEASGPIKSS